MAAFATLLFLAFMSKTTALMTASKGLCRRGVADLGVAAHLRVRRASFAMSTPPSPFDDDDDDDDANPGTPRTTGGFRRVPEVPPQLARSRALVNEGLDGFPNRVAQLLFLGSTFWLGIPALIVFVLSLGASATLYSQLGPRFVHGGTPAGRRPGFAAQQLAPPGTTQQREALDAGAWAPDESRVPFD